MTVIALPLLYIVLSILGFGLYALSKIIRKRLDACHLAQAEDSDDLEKLQIDFSKFTRKTKLKRWIYLIWGTVGVLSFLFGGLMWANNRQMDHLSTKTTQQANDYLTTQAPNIGITNQFIDEYGVFSSNLHMDAYKNLDGYHVSWRPLDFSFGTFFGFGAHASDKTQYYMTASPIAKQNGYYTQDTNQKLAAFFDVTADFKSKQYGGLQPTHDATLLKSASNQLAEVAVTFKKPLSYAQIQKLVPKNLLINWYWIGYDKPTSGADYSTQYFGVAANDESTQDGPLGSLPDGWYPAFVKALKDRSDYYTGTYNHFNPLQDAKKQVKKYPTLAKAKFSGLIVSGRTQNLAPLDKEN